MCPNLLKNINPRRIDTIQYANDDFNFFYDVNVSFIGYPNVTTSPAVNLHGICIVYVNALN